MPSMRDIFLNEIYKYAREDHNVLVVSADFSAPALDQFRLNLPNQYLFTGISEQNMMLVAAGLALEGKKPFCYAIAPFITLRCFEQTRNYAAGMNLPITLVGVGAGISYDDSGYTHHAVEDVSLFRTLPNMQIIQPCDNIETVSAARYAIDSSNPLYVRLDRYGLDSLYNHNGDEANNSIRWINKMQKVNIIASGGILRTAMEVVDRMASEGVDIGLANAYRIPIEREEFDRIADDSELLITLEEHVLPGGLGSHVLELVSDMNAAVRVKRIGFDLSKGFVEIFGGREYIHQKYNMDADSIIRVMKGIMNE